MPDVFLGQTLAFENVSEMAVAVFAKNFDSKSVRVAFVPDRSWQFVIETGPPTSRMKLVGRSVQRSVAATADVKPVVLIVEVLASSGPLGSLSQDDPFFVRCQLVVLLCHQLLHVSRRWPKLI